MSGHGVRRVDQYMAKAAADMLPDEVEDEVRTRYRQLPVMIRTAGLAGTYAFLVSKSKKDTAVGRAYAKLAAGIRHHLTTTTGLMAAVTSNEALIKQLAELSPGDYARAAIEVETLAGWLSRLAEARWQASR